MKSFVPTVFVLASLAGITFAQNSSGTPTSQPLPYNTKAPGATPTYTPRPVPTLLPVQDVVGLAGATVYLPDSALAQAVAAVKNGHKKRGTQKHENRGFIGNFFTGSSTTTSAPVSASSAVTCIGSSNTVKQINTLINSGGAGVTIYLCPSATISIDNEIVFTAANQTMTTRGNPTDNTRATLAITGATISNVITGSCNSCNFLTIQNIQVNGNRPTLGFIDGNYGGSALLELGGVTNGQVLRNVRAYEPRSWSTAHFIEGTNLNCRNATIIDNYLGPAGQGPTGASNQEKRGLEKRDTPPGQWADGLSMACAASFVTGNTIIDATDGGVVVFGAPGSIISGNTIISSTRVLMGGVNMVDYNPWYGNYAGTVVTGNTFNSQGTMMKLGVAIGTQAWGSANKSSQFTSGATVTNNVFMSGSTGYFGFAIGVAGTSNVTVTPGNVFHFANFGGNNTKQCVGGANGKGVQAPPQPGPLYVDPYTVSNANLQSNFVVHVLVFLICVAPGYVYTQAYSTLV